MANANTTILCEKGVIPISLGEFCQHLGESYRIAGADSSVMISSIVAGGNEEVKKGSLFIPYKESDKQIMDIVARGAAVVLTDHAIEGVPCIVVGDVMQAVYHLCKWFYEKIALPSIVICGSEGKTTTKRMVDSVLTQEKQVCCEQGNYNTLHALCWVLTRVESGAELVLEEVDEKRLRNTEMCSLVLKPGIALITNIAEAHLGFYGSREALTDSFRGITAGMDETGVVIINGDDPSSVDARFNAKIITVGIYNEAADCRATNIRDTRHGTEFDLSYQGKTAHVRLSLFGEHNVYNAMMAFVVGTLNGLKTESILQGLAAYRNSGIRQNICRLGQTLVYADCYNASSTSIRYALKCFESIAAGKGKIVAVLGDIAEIDGFEEDTYREIAGFIDASGIDVLVTCGRDSEMIARYLNRKLETIHTSDLDQLNACLSRLKKAGCRAFLFKASRFMELEKSIRQAFPLHWKWMGLREKLHRYAGI